MNVCGWLLQSTTKTTHLYFCSRNYYKKGLYKLLQNTTVWGYKILWAIRRSCRTTYRHSVFWGTPTPHPIINAIQFSQVNRHTGLIHRTGAKTTVFLVWYNNHYTQFLYLEPYNRRFSVFNRLLYPSKGAFCYSFYIMPQNLTRCQKYCDFFRVRISQTDICLVPGGVAPFPRLKITVFCILVPHYYKNI